MIIYLNLFTCLFKYLSISIISSYVLLCNFLSICLSISVSTVYSCLFIYRSRLFSIYLRRSVYLSNCLSFLPNADVRKVLDFVGQTFANMRRKVLNKKISPSSSSIYEDPPALHFYPQRFSFFNLTPSYSNFTFNLNIEHMYIIPSFPFLFLFSFFTFFPPRFP